MAMILASVTLLGHSDDVECETAGRAIREATLRGRRGGHPDRGPPRSPRHDGVHRRGDPPDEDEASRCWASLRRPTPRAATAVVRRVISPASSAARKASTTSGSNCVPAQPRSRRSRRPGGAVPGTGDRRSSRRRARRRRGRVPRRGSRCPPGGSGSRRRPSVRGGTGRTGVPARARERREARLPRGARGSRRPASSRPPGFESTSGRTFTLPTSCSTAPWPQRAGRSSLPPETGGHGVCVRGDTGSVRAEQRVVGVERVLRDPARRSTGCHVPHRARNPSRPDSTADACTCHGSQRLASSGWP